MTSYSSKKIVAAFDFDGTITTKDTLLSFLIYSAGKPQTLKKIFKLSPALIGYLLNMISRQEIKERVIRQFFSGMPYSQMEELGEAFAKSDHLKRLIHPRALKRLEWHKKQKHHCVLISASIDVYLRPWAEKMGFDELICSTVEVDSYGIVSGKLKGPNCWGEEKSKRLSHHLNQLACAKDGYTLFAYGDSRGDQELLAMADYPFFRKMP